MHDMFHYWLIGLAVQNIPLDHEGLRKLATNAPSIQLWPRLDIRSHEPSHAPSHKHYQWKFMQSSTYMALHCIEWSIDICACLSK